MDTDANDKYEFSFRVFDLYRRFVEVLRLNADYMMEFKTGCPSEAVCLDIIKKVFQHKQKEDRINDYMNYLCKNAKTMANHAENLPSHWTEAIKYTDQCIRVIRNFLRAQTIDYKKDFNADSLAKEISKYMYGEPKKAQLEAITDYLRYDIRNPKRTIIKNGRSKKCKKKTKRSSKASEDIDANDSIENALNVIFNESPTTVDNSNDSQNMLESQMLRQKTDVVEKCLEENNVQSQNKPVEETKSSSEKIFRDELKEKCLIEDEDMDEDVESHSFESFESFHEDFIDVVNETPIASKGLKRQRHDIKDDHEFVKKLCSSEECNQQDFQKDSNQPVDCKNKSSENKVQLLAFNGLKSKSVVVNVEKDNISQMKCSNEDLINILEDSKDNKNEDNRSLDFDKSTLTLKSYCNFKQTYLNPTNMTYQDAYKLLDIIMDFCKSKSEICLEELLILRRTRDKMLWRSLKDIKESSNN